MKFRTVVDVPQPSFQIEPLEEILFVGSCFADNIGQRFAEEKFRTTVNPYGTMYNPVSVLHTIERYLGEHPDYKPKVVFITLGTNHVYRLKETGEIVDNCQKRPQSLFHEEQLTIEECLGYLRRASDLLLHREQGTHIVFTVSPIRYQKYGFHESQLSKATLLLTVSQLVKDASLHYFPAYEIVLDELRDYRFYKEDMLHPSAQAVEYIWQQLVEHYFSPRAKEFLKEWKPVKEALAHKPFRSESEEYKKFLQQTQRKLELLQEKYGYIE